MGQYHKLFNLDKKQFVHAHQIDNGLKLMEQCGFEKSTATALWLLVAASNGRGGGGVRSMSRIRRFFAPIEARHVVLAAVCFVVSAVGLGTGAWLAIKLGGCPC